MGVIMLCDLCSCFWFRPRFRRGMCRVDCLTGHRVIERCPCPSTPRTDRWGCFPTSKPRLQPCFNQSTNRTKTAVDSGQPSHACETLIPMSSIVFPKLGSRFRGGRQCGPRAPHLHLGDRLHHLPTIAVPFPFHPRP